MTLRADKVRDLPHNMEAEQALLGAVLVNNEAVHRVSGFLRPDHFSHPLHERIYKTVLKLAERGQKATPVTLKPFFEKDEAMADLGGAEYLVRLAGAAITVSGARDYGCQIYDLFLRRALIGVGEEFIDTAYDYRVDDPASDQVEAAQDQLAQLADLAVKTTRRGQQARLPRIADADCRRWIDKDPPVIEWTVDGLVPQGCTTLLVGDGGAGKSLLGQSLLTCHATGKPFLGRMVKPGAAVGVFCEDGEAILHVRQGRINKVLGVEMDQLTGRCFPQSYSGHNAVLWRGQGPTPFLGSVEDQLAEINELRALVLDPSAMLFGDDEITRIEVTAFVNALNGLAARLGIGVILATHTSKSKDGTALKAASGSTAWVNSCRSVLVLDAGEDDEPYLKLLKSNYAKPGGVIALRWRDGVLIAEEPAEGVFAGITKRNAERAFLDGLKALTAQHRAVSESRNATNFAARLISKTPQARGFRPQELTAAMERLFADGKIRVEEYGRSGDTRRRLVLTPREENEE